MKFSLKGYKLYLFGFLFSAAIVIFNDTPLILDETPMEHEANKQLAIGPHFDYEQELYKRVAQKYADSSNPCNIPENQMIEGLTTEQIDSALMDSTFEDMLTVSHHLYQGSAVLNIYEKKVRKASKNFSKGDINFDVRKCTFD